MNPKIVQFFLQDVDECKTEGDQEGQETKEQAAKEDNIDKSDNNLENVSKVIEEEETTKNPNVTAEPGLESNNDSGIVPNCSQGLTTTDESAENSDHENQISEKPSKAFEQVEEQPNEEESLKLFLEPDTEPMDADIIPSSQKEDIERSVSETSTPVLAKKLQNLGKNFDMEQLKETLSKKVSTQFFPSFRDF